MSEYLKTTDEFDEKFTLSEILFGTLLGIGSITCIWVAATLLFHLYQSFY